MDNLNIFLALKPKKYIIFVIIILILFTGVLFILYFKFSYDVHIFDATVKCNSNCTLNIATLILDKEKITNGSFLKINEQKRNYKIKSIGELEVDYLLMQNFQNFEIETQLEAKLKKENLIIKVYIYSNKERLLTKIIKKII